MPPVFHTQVNDNTFYLPPPQNKPDNRMLLWSKCFVFTLKFIYWNLTLKVMALGGRTLARWLALPSWRWISALVKVAGEGACVLSTPRGHGKKPVCKPTKWALTRLWICQHLDLGLPSHRTARNAFACKPPSLWHFCLQQPEQTETGAHILESLLASHWLRERLRTERDKLGPSRFDPVLSYMIYLQRLPSSSQPLSTFHISRWMYFLHLSFDHVRSLTRNDLDFTR